jgi:protein arginine kinase
MVVDTLVKRPGSWLSMCQDTGIIISSRVRLARNLNDRPFPVWADAEERTRICQELLAAFHHVASLKDPIFLDMGAIAPVDKEILKERHLISNELAARGTGSGLLVSGDEHIAVMINEEDHLRIQVIRPGMKLPEIWAAVDQLDTELEEHVEYAFSHRLGYLTACPSNLGTGLRASVMMHLSGLRLTNEMDPLINGLERIGVTVRGLLGEGTEAYGNMFQISNRTTVGESETQIIERLTAVVDEVAAHEKNARARLMEDRRSVILDQVGRAVGIALNARIISSNEAVEILSALRLGVDFDMIKEVTAASLNEIMLLTQPGHLQKISGEELTPEDRDELRARLIRRN